MPALSPLLAITVKTVAPADAFAPRFEIATTSTRTASDSLEVDFTVTAELEAALQSSVRVVGVQLSVDKGDGQMTPLLQTEIDGAVNLKESRDGYGAKTLSFSLQIPASQSPFYIAWSRGPHRVTMTGYLGLPGAMQPRPMFEGFVTQCSWEAYPSLLRVDCQDISVLWASETFAYNLDPGSLRTRKDVFVEVCDLHGIPKGQLDFGSDDGGQLSKGISEGGTTALLGWMVDFLAPIARRLTWDGGVCNVEPSYATGVPVRRFRSNDIFGLSVSLPATTDANAVVMSGTVFGFIGVTGLVTEVEIKMIRGLFAPETAVKKQDHTTGSITDLSLAIDPAVQEISRTVTTRVRQAGTIISTIVEEWGWYSAQACTKEQAAGTGDVSWNSQFDVFQYRDGTWRLEHQQQYQVLRHTNTSRFWNADLTLATEITAQQQFGIGIVPIAGFNDDTTENPRSCLMTEEGVAWAGGREYYGGGPDIPPAINGGLASTTTITTFAADADGHLTTTTRRTKTRGDFYYFITLETLAAIAAAGGFTMSSPPAGAYAVFGPLAHKQAGQSNILTYGYALITPPESALDVPAAPYVTTFYTPVDETSHREKVTVSPESGFRWSVELDYSHMPVPPSPSDAVVAGAPPMIERIANGQTAQAASATVVDTVRKGLLGKEVDDYQQNDFCQTVDELKTAALELLRDRAPVLAFDAPIDWTTKVGAPITILLPDAIPTGEVLTVWDIEWSFDGRTGDNKQHVTARFLPTELR